MTEHHLQQLLEQPFQCYWVTHQRAKGVTLMALDDALLTWCCQTQETPKLIVRTYQWCEPTLSMGVHQSQRSMQQAYERYEEYHPLSVVRRPTGGRSILHYEDVSFAFVTNIPYLYRLPLRDSYCLFNLFVKQALEAAGVLIKPACDLSESGYTASALCFETKTTSDILAADGSKIAGASQLRRKEGILQHGAAFLIPYQVTAAQFDAALQQQVLNTCKQKSPVTLLSVDQEPLLSSLLAQSLQRYVSESASILATVSTTSGSHLVPDSD